MTATSAATGSSLWTACPGCRSPMYGEHFRRSLRVCPECGHHDRFGARERIAQLFDAGSVSPLGAAPTVEDPLGFADTRPYALRLRQAREGTGLEEAVLCVTAAVRGLPVVAAVMDFAFMGGSLGCAVGERITAAAEHALATGTPLVLVTASGGARMQEGSLALMQMAKTSQALADLDDAGLLTVSVVTDPTYGGVAASYATLADVIVAEAGAHMGFAGPRVIAGTIGQALPAGFQTAETLLAGGLVDGVRRRAELRPLLARLVGAAAWAARGRPVPGEWRTSAPPLVTRPEELPERDAWATVTLARDPGRPTTLDYASCLLDDFLELRGDRVAGDCPAIVGGVGTVDGVPVVLIGHQKGHDTRELVARNFGMGSPQGFRKAARLMRLAGKLGLPVVTLIDTPGAHAGVEAEAGGQAHAIAENLRLMSRLRVPVVAVVTGEGGSGGALALGVADRVLALGNAVYSVISPEGCAAILWRDASAAPQAAGALRLGARELLRHGVVDAVVPEPDGGAHQDPSLTARLVRGAVTRALHDLVPLAPDDLIRARRRRFRLFGTRR
ncbi:acetyl-CoA carboxylase carboxyltransferase subunit alpha [Sphaerisporangium sp. TRM90804]|uniref:acetyl-CoA carboxylase carboxyltransferase subunit alpha n=1 Tax=Sphaerisporangium sp. TRM90804 TaxID=3031113 RepID=UPI002448C93C|nr:acetyl-CoA carboxylase carboxyltransferase subunit alpha [Sphaerisporangium sp. TRM90804]MDH2426171.1 acetyl-CoA carboxylase carboxyltransferase subunit alpha [Sphaerisporangium sp. TRM90804]